LRPTTQSAYSASLGHLRERFGRARLRGHSGQRRSSVRHRATSRWFQRLDDPRRPMRTWRRVQVRDSPPGIRRHEPCGAA
jgi:hypothetical protein